MASSFFMQEVLYVRRLLTDLGFPQDLATEAGNDTRKCIALSEGSVEGRSRAKRIDLSIHFVHAPIRKTITSLHSIKSERKVADVLTKALPEPASVTLRKQLWEL